MAERIGDREDKETIKKRVVSGLAGMAFFASGVALGIAIPKSAPGQQTNRAEAVCSDGSSPVIAIPAPIHNGTKPNEGGDIELKCDTGEIEIEKIPLE